MLEKSELGMYGGRPGAPYRDPDGRRFQLRRRRAEAPSRAEYFQQSSRAPEQQVIDTWLASPGAGLPAVPVRIPEQVALGPRHHHLRAVAAGARLESKSRSA